MIAFVAQILAVSSLIFNAMKKSLHLLNPLSAQGFLTLRALDKRRARQNLTVNLLPPSLASNAIRWAFPLEA